MRPEKWTILLTGDNSGIVGRYGERWPRNPDRFERVDVYAQAPEPARPEEKELPGILFDGYSVYQALSEKVKARTSPENVSDVLDAIVRALKSSQPAVPEITEQPGLF